MAGIHFNRIDGFCTNFCIENYCCANNLACLAVLLTFVKGDFGGKKIHFAHKCYFYLINAVKTEIWQNGPKIFNSKLLNLYIRENASCFGLLGWLNVDLKIYDEEKHGANRKACYKMRHAQLSSVHFVEYI